MVQSLTDQSFDDLVIKDTVPYDMVVFNLNNLF